MARHLPHLPRRHERRRLHRRGLSEFYPRHGPRPCPDTRPGPGPHRRPSPGPGRRLLLLDR